jgi:hypothetical protein
MPPVGYYKRVLICIEPRPSAAGIGSEIHGIPSAAQQQCRCSGYIAFIFDDQDAPIRYRAPRSAYWRTGRDKLDTETCSGRGGDRAVPLGPTLTQLGETGAGVTVASNMNQN